MPTPARDVFVSYAGEDRETAGAVCTLLEGHGISCWIAPRDVAPGCQWDEAILDAIESSRALLLVLSTHSNRSQFVKNEVNRAFAQGRPIFTLRIEDVLPARALELYLATHHWTDAFPPPLDGRISLLAGAVRQLLDRQAVDGAVAGTAAPSAADLARAFGVLPIEAGGHGIAAVSRGRAQAIVGRDTETAALRASFARLREGTAMLTVAGDAGIGKSTLVQQFLADATEAGVARVARGHCSERFSGTGAYLPLVEALDSLVRGPGGAAATAAIAATAPHWFHELNAAAGTAPPAGQASSERMVREFIGALESLATDRTLILLVDDLHWSDAATVDVLSHLAMRRTGPRILVLGTYRPSEMGATHHPMLRLKQDLVARGVCEEIVLGSLGRDAVTTYVDAEFPNHAFPAEFLDVVFRRTEGHPLFMADLLRHLRTQNAIAQRDGAWVLTESLRDIERTLPQSVQNMVARKLDVLDDVSKQLLVCAAVCGDVFDSAIVAAAGGIDPGTVEERLEQLERPHGIVRFVDEQELPDGTLTARYRFGHALYQNALYTSLRPARRATLSRAVATTLLRTHGDRAARVATQLALLFEAARDFDEASTWFLAAAGNAAALGALREAESLAARGIQACASLPEAIRDRRELQLQLARYAALQGLYTVLGAETTVCTARIRVLGEQLGEMKPLLLLQLIRAFTFMMVAQPDAAIAAAEDALRAGQSLGDDVYLGVSHHVLAWTTSVRGRRADAESHWRRAFALFGPGPHPAVAALLPTDPVVQSRVVCASQIFNGGRFAEALALAEEGLAIARQTGLANSVATALVTHVTLLLQSGRLDAAERDFRELAALLEANPMVLSLFLPFLQGWITVLKDNRIDEGVALMGETPARLAAIQFRFGQASFQGTRADILCGAGRYREAHALATTALEEARATLQLDSVPMLVTVAACAHLGLADGGDPAAIQAAVDGVQQAIATAATDGSQLWLLRGATALARWHAARGDVASALDVLEPAHDRFAAEPLVIPSLDRARALLTELQRQTPA